MITRKELDYVSSWAKNTPYPGRKYAEEALENLAISIEDFKRFYNGKQYELVLSNGEQFSFEILEKNLCHLLGIDYKNLIGQYFDYYRYSVLKLDDVPKSFDLLTRIIDNFDAVIDYDEKTGGKAINYYRIMIKCAIFEKLSDFSRFNFGVINFDKDIYQNNTRSNFGSNSEKFLYVQSNEPSAPYFMMGILHDGSRFPLNGNDASSNDFVPETLIAPTNTRDFFNNQEVVIPTQILVSTTDSMDKKEASASDKIALLNQYKAIIKEHNIPNLINIYGDYESMLVAQETAVKRRTLKNEQQ